jgi:N-acyl-D-amino-acid deacylase
MAAYDLLIVNATVLDGTGAPGQPASVAVTDDTIAAIGEIPTDAAGRVIDGAGLVLAPGFSKPLHW